MQKGLKIHLPRMCPMKWLMVDCETNGGINWKKTEKQKTMTYLLYRCKYGAYNTKSQSHKPDPLKNICCERVWFIIKKYHNVNFIQWQNLVLKKLDYSSIDHAICCCFSWQCECKLELLWWDVLTSMKPYLVI